MTFKDLSTINLKVLTVSGAIVACVVCLLSLLGISFCIQSVTSERLIQLNSFVTTRGLEPYIGKLFLIINLTAIAYACSNNYKSWLVPGLLVCLYPLLLFGPGQMGLIADVYVLLYSIALRRDSKIVHVIARFVEVNLIFIVYHVIGTIGKLGYFTESKDLMFINNFIYQIDFVIFMVVIVYFYRKVSENYDKMVLERRKFSGYRLVSYFYAGEIKLLWNRRKNETASTEVNATVTLRKDDAIWLWIFNLSQIVFIGLMAAINGKFMVFVFLFLGFYVQKLGNKGVGTYHAPTLIGCWIQSAIFFFVITMAVPSTRVSIFIPLISGALAYSVLAWIAKIIRGHIKFEDMTKAEKQKVIDKVFTREKEHNLAILIWIEEKKLPEIAKLLSYAEATLANEKSRLLRQLNSSI